MQNTLLVPPQSEPFSLENLKSFLKVDHGFEDVFISFLGKAARQAIEKAWDIAFLKQTWKTRTPLTQRFSKNCFVKLPFLSLTEVKIFDCQGVELSQNFFFWKEAPEAITIDLSFTPPSPYTLHMSYQAGFGDTPDQIPAPLLQALFLLVATWFEKRDSSEIPQSVRSLVQPWISTKI